MTQIKIEKKVALPVGVFGRGRGSIYPFAGMQVGDSFFAEGKRLQPVMSSANAYSKFHSGGKKKFTCRTETNGTRCWRTK